MAGFTDAFVDEHHRPGGALAEGAQLLVLRRRRSLRRCSPQPMARPGAKGISLTEAAAGYTH